jgi:CheY-like chemotaxis protein
MPGTVDGLGLTRLLRSRGTEIPVVLTSGDHGRAAEAKIANGFVRKPYRASALARRIGRMIAQEKP